MQPSRPIWEALLAIAGGRAARWTWRHVLGEAWPGFEPLLRRVGQVVDRLPCPGPYGDGCPRHVVTHDDGRVVAVCGDPNGQCDRLVLQKGDNVVLELNHQLLARALGQYLKLKDELLPLQLPNCVWQLGWFEPLAGERFAVCLLLPASDDQVHETAIRLQGSLDKPFVLVVPLHKQAASETVEYLRGGQSRILHLEDLLGVEAGEWSALPSTAGALDSFRNDVVGGSRFSMPEHRFPTPPGSTWKDVFIRFVDGHQINVRIKSQSRVFDYAHLDMVNKKETVNRRCNGTYYRTWPMVMANMDGLGFRTGEHSRSVASGWPSTCRPSSESRMIRSRISRAARASRHGSRSHPSGDTADRDMSPMQPQKIVSGRRFLNALN